MNTGTVDGTAIVAARTLEVSHRATVYRITLLDNYLAEEVTVLFHVGTAHGAYITIAYDDMGDVDWGYLQSKLGEQMARRPLLQDGDREGWAMVLALAGITVW